MTDRMNHQSIWYKAVRIQRMAFSF